MTSMPQDFKNFIKTFLDIFVYLVPVEIFSHYPNIDNAHWLIEDFQSIIDKDFREKFMV